MSKLNLGSNTKHRTKYAMYLLASALTLGLAMTACNEKANGPVDNPGTDTTGTDTTGTDTTGADTSLCANAVMCTPLATLLDTGATVFENCTGCHGPTGHGSAANIPPLANSDFFINNKTRTIAIVLQGKDDSTFVNGQWYQGTMPSHSYYSNFYIASVLTYLRVQLNDSTVVSCNSDSLDVDGFAICEKTPRDSLARYTDTVAVWQVKHVRDSLGIEEPTF